MISTKRSSNNNSDNKHVVTKQIVTASLVKPIIAASSIFLIDRFVLNNTNTKSNLLFASSVGIGIFFSSSLGAVLKNHLPTSTPIGALNKNLESRMVEIVSGSGSAYLINNFILKNDYSYNQILYKLGLIVASDIIAETVAEIILKL